MIVHNMAHPLKWAQYIVTQRGGSFILLLLLTLLKGKYEYYIKERMLAEKGEQRGKIDWHNCNCN